VGKAPPAPSPDRGEPLGVRDGISIKVAFESPGIKKISLLCVPDVLCVRYFSALVFLVAWWFTLHFVLTMILRFFDFSNLQPVLPETI
jgi:hypothetical protein